MVDRMGEMPTDLLSLEVFRKTYPDRRWSDIQELHGAFLNDPEQLPGEVRAFCEATLRKHGS
ncbi:MAG TPA: hypothetical protein VHD37_03060 [Candidatus Paceibacterota bacterium]|nr:hypothetical protein [Candidatus Paceibacterota bacterium]